MPVLKCKMCGGSLQVDEGQTVCECEYCGTRQTIPSVDDEKKLNLYNRANRLRSNNEFDKAYGVFESLVADFPEEAEAYWGLCLCKYGIEYVDDPLTGKKIPTCHRTSYESIFDDNNFEMALEYADGAARGIYREEAKEIDRLQKAILEIAKNEEPFDIFICYKETDEYGDRTIDSVIAQDVYTALTEKGYKVFFSRITLEDKLGQEYEPYIFAALNSAKVMLAFGTSYDYYNAVWVKNEWSRYLDLMKKDKNKYLIPCYKGIDAYDMPKEFSHLQAQDMGKVGALQDLLRGIEKIIPREQKKTEIETVVQTGVTNTGALLKRAYMFLEDRDFEKANEYFEKVLDQDPENGSAYYGELLCQYKKASMDELINSKKYVNVSTNRNCVRVIKYGTSEEKEAIERLRTRVQKNLLAISLSRAINGIRNKKTEEENEILARFKQEELLNQDRLMKQKEDARIEEYREQFDQRINRINTLKRIISAGFYVFAGAKPDGTIAVISSTKEVDENDFSGWKNIKSVVVGNKTVYGLRYDGTVIAGGNNAHKQCSVQEWNDVLQVVPNGVDTVFGLRRDGTVVGTGYDNDGSLGRPLNAVKWNGIKKLFCSSIKTIGISNDGKLLSTDHRDKTDSRDILYVSTSGDLTAVLRSDGTVEILCRYDVSDLIEYTKTWKNIWHVETRNGGVVAIDKNGKVKAINTGIDAELNKWDSVIQLILIDRNAYNMNHAVGLKSDGTIIVNEELFNNENYKKIKDNKYVGIIGNNLNTLFAIKEDGKVDAVFSDYQGVDKIRLFNNIDEVSEEQKQLINSLIENKKTEIENLKTELNNIKGLFANIKKRDIETKITEKEKELSYLSTKHDNEA